MTFSLAVSEKSHFFLHRERSSPQGTVKSVRLGKENLTEMTEIMYRVKSWTVFREREIVPGIVEQRITKELGKCQKMFSCFAGCENCYLIL